MNANMNFNGALDRSAIRIWHNNKMLIWKGQYTLEYTDVNTYAVIPMQKKSLRTTNFMLKITELNGKDVFEKDIVEYSDTRGAIGRGVVIFSNAQCSAVIKDTDSSIEYPLCLCKIGSVVGNLYENEKLLDFFERPNTQTEKEPEDAIEIYPSYQYFNGEISWTYTLSGKGRKPYTKTGVFKKTQEEPKYYMLASAIIALSKISGKNGKNCVIYSSHKSLCDLVNSSQLTAWEKNSWKKKDGREPSNCAELKMLKENIDRLKALNVSIRAELSDEVNYQIAN